MKTDDIGLFRIKVEKTPSDIPDQLTVGIQDQFALEKQAFELEILKQNQANLQKSFTISNWLAGGIFLLVLITLAAVFGIIIWQGNICLEHRLMTEY